MASNKVYFNKSQIEAMIVDAPEYWGIKGRGTGKTEGDLSIYSSRRVQEMPRETFALIGATFQQILTRTLPPLVAGWERLGYKQDVHYVIGKKPTEKWIRQWGWRGPFRPPFSHNYSIHWYNGACIQMVSQDRIGSTNGMSLGGVFGDEAKLLNRERLNSETLPANRGVNKLFADNPHHHFLAFTTDMPVGTSGRWILEKEHEMDPERITQIKQLVYARTQRLHQIAREGAGCHAATLKKDVFLIDWKIKQLKRHIEGVQNSMVFFQESSTLENIYALGIPYIRQMMRNLSDHEFKTSILNRRPHKLEDGFYPDLDEEKHGYFAYDYHKFLNTGYKLETLIETDGGDNDADWDKESPLHISLDYNRVLCPMVVGQIEGDMMRAINGIESEYPEKLIDTLRKFCDYYDLHRKKVVYYWYDHTATSEYAHAGEQSVEVVNYLRKRGWVVVEKYIGKASGHERRYTMFGHLLKEDGHYKYRLRINRERCKYLLLSCYQAQAEYRKKGFGKNKKNETKVGFPQKEATHYSEALDMWIFGVLESGLNFIELQSEGIGIGFF